MSEKPGAQTPWLEVNQLLAPDERFEIYFPHWQGWLLAPKHASQLAALLYLLRQKRVAISIQGKGTCSLPIAEQSVIVSARAFSQIIWHEQGVVEVGAGCSLTHLHQFLFERNQEAAFEEDFVASSKRSIAGLILSGRTSGLRYRSESLQEILLGVELVTWEGSQIKWGSHHRSAVAGPALHKLMWGLNALPGMAIKFMLKTYPIPSSRLRLAWNFLHKEALWKQFQDLKQFSSTWEYLEIVLSGNSTDRGFIFAQISGFPEEMEAFSKICPGYAAASQQGERLTIKNFLIQQKLQAHLVDIHYSIEPGEYLWWQEGSQKAWLLTSRSFEKREDLPIWKQRFFASISKILT